MSFLVQLFPVRSLFTGEVVYYLLCMAPLVLLVSMLSILDNSIVFLPPATKLGQGYIFTGVCDSVHRGRSGHGESPILGGSLQFRGGVSPIFGGSPIFRGSLQFFRGSPIFSGGLLIFFSFFFNFFPQNFFWDAPTPAGMHHPPPRRSMRGRYASYWNAFLFI